MTISYYLHSDGKYYAHLTPELDFFAQPLFFVDSNTKENILLNPTDPTLLTRSQALLDWTTAQTTKHGKPPETQVLIAQVVLEVLKTFGNSNPLKKTKFQDKQPQAKSAKALSTALSGVARQWTTQTPLYSCLLTIYLLSNLHCSGFLTGNFTYTENYWHGKHCAWILFETIENEKQCTYAIDASNTTHIKIYSSQSPFLKFPVLKFDGSTETALNELNNPNHTLELSRTRPLRHLQSSTTKSPNPITSTQDHQPHKHPLEPSKIETLLKHPAQLLIKTKNELISLKNETSYSDTSTNIDTTQAFQRFELFMQLAIFIKTYTVTLTQSEAKHQLTDIGFFARYLHRDGYDIMNEVYQALIKPGTAANLRSLKELAKKINDHINTRPKSCTISISKGMRSIASPT